MQKKILRVSLYGFPLQQANILGWQKCGLFHSIISEDFMTLVTVNKEIREDLTLSSKKIHSNPRHTQT